MSSPISGFTAIPNPQMLAFMPIQSYLMMYFAGSGWQYGKRRISAMSNEQFNKLTPEELLKQHSIELKNMLPTLDKTLDDVTPLIKTLVEQYGDFVREAIKAIPDAIGNIFKPTTGSIQDSQFGITNVRYTRPPEGQIESTKQYWEQLAKDAWEHASKIADAKPIPALPEHDITQAHHKLPTKDFNLPTAQLSVFEKARNKKRRAGQSQRVARVQFIQNISKIAKDLNVMRKARGFTTKQTFYRLTLVKLKQEQQRLVNLLARYQF